jgi:hypothetical protein
MSKAWMALAVGAMALALAGCGSKKTGPEAEDSAAAAPETATPVAAATADPGAAKPLASFAGMDSDGDGFVSSAEHAKAAQTMFQMMDADKDGAVTVVEMDAAQAAIGGSKALSSEKKIGTIDAAGDGKLTLAEYVAGSNGMFASMDADKDDRLDRAEWDQGHAMLSPTPETKP